VSILIAGKPANENRQLRKRWVAALLSLLLPGLGQMYNGQLRKGVAFYLSTTIVGVLLFAVACKSLSLVLITSAILIQFSLHLAAAIDGGRTARRIGDDFRPARYNRPLVYLGVYLLFGLLVSEAPAFYIRENIVQAFNLPSASMEPTLFLGDHILVDKSAANFSRGDIVVFEFPEDAEKKYPRAFIKRIVGLPGDEIEVRDKTLLVNGRPAKEPYIAHREPTTLPATMAPRDFFGPVTVPEGTYFMLGDNRDRSYDSRFWGFVDRDKVHGRAALVYWSWDRKESEVRWERIGRKIL
jgi:signal peptidase I